MSWTRARDFAWLAALLAAHTMFPAPAPAEPQSFRPWRTTPARLCDGAIHHPIEVRAAALDPLARGSVVRVRVTTRSRQALERGEVRLVSAGGAQLVGPGRLALGRLEPGGEVASEFAIRLPAEGRRFLIQFRVTGDGGGGLESRGATLNLLPDGPADPGRVVTTNTGARVTEYRARRIEP